MLLVRQRTTHILSFQSLIYRLTGKNIRGQEVKTLDSAGLVELLTDDYSRFAGQINIALIGCLTKHIKQLEQKILQHGKLRPEYKNLHSIPGVAEILSLTIMYETGDIKRFADAGKYASYCRCVKSKHLSNGKKKGQGNRKNGNRYLSWAFIEAAHHAQRSYEPVKKFYQRKLAKRNVPVARKALACKLCKAAYFIIRDQVPFDMHKVFG